MIGAGRGTKRISGFDDPVLPPNPLSGTLESKETVVFPRKGCYRHEPLSYQAQFCKDNPNLDIIYSGFASKAYISDYN